MRGVGHWAGVCEHRCVLLSMPGLGRLVLGAFIIVIDIGVACSIFLVICFLVVVLVFVCFAVVGFPVCGVAINIDSVVAVVIFVGVVSRGIFVVVGSVLFFVAVFVFSSDVISVVAVVVHVDGCWWVQIDRTERRGTGQEEKGKFIV